MLRVLMLLEDYGELMFLQTVLKKLGFDVDAIQNPRMLSDASLRMNPELLIMTAFGKRVKGAELCKQLRRSRGLPRVLLLNAGSAPKEADVPVEGWCESPVSAVSFLNALADTCDLNKQMLQEKFAKLKMGSTAEEFDRTLKIPKEAEPTMDRAVLSSGNFGKMKPSTMSSEERKSRYDKFLKEKPPMEKGMNAKAVAEQVRELRKREKPGELEDLERQRREFVEHLFKKKA